MFSLSVLILFSFNSTRAQIQQPDAPPVERSERQRRPNLMEALGLTSAQRLQIRQINIESKPQMRHAQEALREANRLLDQAIYADNVLDNEIQTRTQKVHEAQAEILRVRLTTELAIRRVLTPQQLAKFREVRRQFMEDKADRFNRNEPPVPPDQQFRNRPQRPRPNQ